jgi:hypothetical protein
MTFKHSKFEDSPTMRSLIKVAADKGWVKPEPIEKTASIQEDLSPTGNLTINVLKLCAGLRKSGMYKAADEIENKFVAYKQANTMYDVHGEEGKDLIDAAHPKGGHKMENVEGDAFIETILEKQLKILDVVNKKPSGKLASHNSILSAVRVVLGQDALAAQKAKYKEMVATLTSMVQALGKHDADRDKGDNRLRTMVLLNVPAPTLGKKINVGVPVGPEDVAAFKAAAKAARGQLMYIDPGSKEFTEATAKYRELGNSDAEKADIKSAWSKVIYRVQDFGVWNALEELFKQWDAQANEMSSLAAGGLDAFTTKLDKQLARLSGFRSLLKDEGFTADDRTQGEQWIKYFTDKLNNWKSVFAGITDADQKVETAKKYEGKLTELMQQMNEFEQKLK